MTPFRFVAALALAGTLSTSCARATPADTPARGIRLTRFTSGLDKPVHLVAAPGDDRLYVVDRDGRIAYKSAAGPFGFKPAEVEATLGRLLPPANLDPEARFPPR